MTVYMAVTDDEYELPIAVAYTTQELEKMLGLGRQAVYNYLNRAKKESRKSRNTCGLSWTRQQNRKEESG